MKLAELSLSRKLFVANICASYYAAAQYPLIHKAGLSWYRRANQQARDMASRYGVSLECVIGTIAALSPRNSWERNLVSADVCLKVVSTGGNASNFKTTTFDGNKRKAVVIAQGADPLGILSGPKTRDFYINISQPDHSTVVVIDGHAVHIAMSRIAALESSPSLSDKSYHFFANCYRQATNEINNEINADSLLADVLPSQVQAITWQYYRVLKGYDTSFKLA